jgi:SnoaL-like domain
MTSLLREVALERLIATEAIRTVCARYCQAIDRCDIDLLKSLFWPDAIDDHGLFVGNAMEFADFVMPMLRTMQRTVHHVFNIDINLLSSTQAKVQSYCMAYHEMNGNELVVGVRLLDEFERRQEEWRILQRICIADWNQMRPVASDWAEDGLLSSLRPGRRGPDDPTREWSAKAIGSPMSPHPRPRQDS